MYIDINELSIQLDSSVKHITRTACMAISGTLENGLALSCNPSHPIVIYNDRIEFGKSLNPQLNEVYGLIYPNFYREYGNIVYRFGSNYKLSFFTRTMDYCGVMPPEVPDNVALFNLIYPKFA